MNYPIPVYINQNLVFDLIAMIEDGLSTVSNVKVTSTQNDSLSSQNEFGVSTSNILSSLFSLKLSSKFNSDSKSDQSNEVGTEKIHTPSSLFFKLKNHLTEKKSLKELNDAIEGDFILHKIKFEEKGMSHYFKKYVDFLEMSHQISLFDSNAKGEQLKKNKQHQRNFAQNAKVSREIYEQINSTKIFDLLGKDEENNSIVVSANKDYMNLDAFNFGNYYVLGKVSKIIKENESFDLLRNTKFSNHNDLILDKLVTLFKGINKDAEVSKEDVLPVIKGKSYQITPIGIYI